MKKRTVPGPDAQWAPDVHTRIVLESGRLHGEPLQWRHANRTPDLANLLDAARDVLGRSTPGSFIYQGRTYWLRTSIGLAQIEVFDGAKKRAPLARAIVGRGPTCGHVPGKTYE